jgi:hypothetical protein
LSLGRKSPALAGTDGKKILRSADLKREKKACESWEKLREFPGK